MSVDATTIGDAGPTERGLESTIVAATGGPLRLLRPGPIEVNAIQAPSQRIEAPGQLASHYAPSKPLRMNATAAEGDEYWIGFGPFAGDASLSPSGDLVGAAARLFDLLHQADESLTLKRSLERKFCRGFLIQRRLRLRPNRSRWRLPRGCR